MLQYTGFIFLLFSDEAQIVMRIQAESSVRIALQVTGEAFPCRDDFPFHIHLFRGNIGQRILLIGFKADSTRHLGGKRSKLIHAVGFHINGFQIAHGKTCFFAARILGDNVFIGFDGAVVIIILIVQQSDFGGSLTTDGAFGIFVQQFPEGCDGLTVIAALHIRTAFFVKCTDGIGRIRIFVGQPVQQRNLSIVVLLQTRHQSQLIVGVVTGRRTQIFCPGIVLFGFVEAADVHVAVADTVVRIGKNGCVSGLSQLDEFQETVLRRCIIFLMESYVCQIVVGKGIHFRIFLWGKGQIIVKITGGFLHAVQPVIGFTPPVKGIGLCLQVIPA